MTLSYAVDRQGRMLSEGMPPDVEKRLDTVMEEIDCVFPEFLKAADRAGLELVFMSEGVVDGKIPANKELTTNSFFDALHTILYFDEPGSRVSLPHEFGHFLDVFSSDSPFPRSLELIYPSRRMTRKKLLAQWEERAKRSNDAGAYIRAIWGAAPDQSQISIVSQNMAGGGRWAGADISINDFIQERWANLFERFVDFSLRSLGKEPVWFNNAVYRSDLCMWSDQYMAANAEQLGKLFGQAISRIACLSFDQVDEKKAELLWLYKFFGAGVNNKIW